MKKTNDKTAGNATVSNTADMIGEGLSFDGTEAFNLLRTNVFFSFSGEKQCPVVAVTSPSPGDGKSTIAVNLAYAMAKFPKKVLIIEGDLRLPTVAAKTGLSQKPGLSNVLTSDVAAQKYIQKYNGVLDVLAAGDIPPRPSELLGSDKMGRVLEELKSSYDYIVIDLPPVTVVPDALAIAKYLDGVILTVRKEYDEKPQISETLRQLEIAKANVLGFVFNDSRNES